MTIFLAEAASSRAQDEPPSPPPFPHRLTVESGPRSFDRISAARARPNRVGNTAGFRRVPGAVRRRLGCRGGGVGRIITSRAAARSADTKVSRAHLFSQAR